MKPNQRRGSHKKASHVKHGAQSHHPHSTNNNSNHHPIPAILHHRPAHRRRTALGSCSPIRQRAIHIDLLRAIDIHDLHVARIRRLRAVEQRVVVRAVVVVVAPTLRVLLADTHHGQRLVLVRVVVNVVVIVIVGVCIGAVRQDSGEEGQGRRGKKKRRQAAWCATTRGVGRCGSPGVVGASAVRGLSTGASACASSGVAGMLLVLPI